MTTPISCYGIDMFHFIFIFLSCATAAVHTFEGSNQLLSMALTLRIPQFSRTLTQWIVEESSLMLLKGC